MNRLQSELHRLYLHPPHAYAQTDAQPPALIDSLDRVRAMVFELTRPPSWATLSRIWQGVQTELGLPAPAIAVSGTDGLQLWFSLEEPIAVSQAHAFMEALRSRFLPDVEPSRVRLKPASDASACRERHAALVPAVQEDTGNWSAFVAPDLAPVFAETPWLDIPPSEEGQAALLRGLETMDQTAFEVASKQLAQSAHATGTTVGDRSAGSAGSAKKGDDPKRFLQEIMNDATIALPLRIEAAKALLQHANDRLPREGE